MADKLKCEKG